MEPHETIECSPPREEEVPDFKMRHIIKTKVSKQPQGGQRRNTDRIMAWDPLQLANLQEKYGRKSGESETKYL